MAQLICLLKQGAKVNAADKKGLTPLHYAALIDDPANYAKQTSWSAKAMTFGYLVDSWSSQTKVRYDGLEAVKILLVAGADPHRLTNAGKTAFDLSPSPRTREILDLAMSAKK